jgi:hypothetical protein
VLIAFGAGWLVIGALLVVETNESEPARIR